MKSKTILVTFVAILLFNQTLMADSPVTSTEFWQAYSDVPIVMQASEAGCVLTKPLMKYLIDPQNPIAVKMAVINEIGWESLAGSNSRMFFEYVKKKKKFKNEQDFLNRADADLLLCMAYLKAMENYFYVDEAVIFAQKAKEKSNGSFTVHIICAIIEAQQYMEGDWCMIYRKTDDVRQNKSLVIDMNDEAIRIIFEYMDGYGYYCGE